MESFNECESTTLQVSPRLLIAGLRSRYENSGSMQAIPQQWQRFASYLGKIPGQVGRVTYGLCFRQNGGIDYLSGVELSDWLGMPREFDRVHIPEQRYAVFPHNGHVSEIRSALEEIGQKWLPSSGLQLAKPAPGAPDFFERYGDNFDPVSGVGHIEFWFPIQS